MSKTLHINAQAERIHQTTTFKPLLASAASVPMDGFYEWKPDKSPVRFAAAGANSFAWPDCGRKWKKRALICRLRKMFCAAHRRAIRALRPSTTGSVASSATGNK